MPIHAMVQQRHSDSVVAGSIVFREHKPWQEWRLSSALHVISVGRDEFRYERQRYRIFGNFFKLEPQYTTGIIADRIEYFPRIFSYKSYNAVQIGLTRCIFKMDNAQYIIGKTAEREGKVHALNFNERTMWNGTPYFGVSYLCSGGEISGTVEVKPLHKDSGVTMDTEVLRQHRDMITCSNCLRKLT